MAGKQPTEYQKDAIDAVTTAFKNGKSRYLVADEAGLGKTIIAKGVIEQFWNQSKNKTSQKPFIVIYFGSNLFLLNDTIGKLVDGSADYNQVVDVDRFDELIKYEEMEMLPTEKINIVACSANILNDDDSKNGEPKERLLCRNYIYQHRDCPQLKTKIVGQYPNNGWGWFNEKTWDELKSKKLKEFVGTIKETDSEFINLINPVCKDNNSSRPWCATFRKYLNQLIMKSDRLHPDLVIVDEFHRYDDILVGTIAPLLAQSPTTKLLMLSATPYNLYRDEWGTDFKEISDDENGTSSTYFPNFGALLRFVVNDETQYNKIRDCYEKYLNQKITAAQMSQCLMGYIYRNERPVFGNKKYNNIPTFDDIIQGKYDDQINYITNIIKNKKKSDVTKFEKIVPGVYSFPVKTFTVEHDDLYEGFPEPNNNLDDNVLQNADFIFSDNGLDEKRIKECFHTKLIQEYVADIGRNLLWVPTTKLLYSIDEDNVFSKAKDFSKLLVFSNYKMIPRAVSAIFSSYADEGVNGNAKLTTLYCMNEWVENFDDNLIVELMEAYAPCKNDTLPCVIERVKRKVNNQITLTDTNQIELLSLYIIASPFACAWRLLKNEQDNELKKEKVRQIATAFDKYFEKRKSVLARNKINDERELLLYCANGNLQAVLAEYAFCNKKWVDNIVSVLKGESKGHKYNPEIHIYKKANYKNPDEMVQTVPCHFALRYDSDYKDNGGSDTSDEGRTYKELVKTSFNAPFWPFILCTTSVAQEGVDLDTYSNRIMHYSLPNSTMAFEQRDGRIDRRRSLLARKNMVKMFGDPIKPDILNYWMNLFEQNKCCSGMSPNWVQQANDDNCLGYIERIIPYFPGTPEYVYFTKLVREKDKYRRRFGMPNESVGSNVDSLKLNKI